MDSKAVKHHRDQEMIGKAKELARQTLSPSSSDWEGKERFWGV